MREVLDTLEEGSAVEGLARIAMLISKAGRGRHRLSQMQKTRELLSPEREITHLSEDARRRLLQEETIVVEFEPERAKRSLPRLLRTAADRRRAHALLEWTEAQPRPRGAPAPARGRAARDAADNTTGDRTQSPQGGVGRASARRDVCGGLKAAPLHA